MALLSIIIPIYNEEEAIAYLFPALSEALQPLKELGVSCDYLCINDGSSDRSFEMLSQIAGAESSIKVINFSRNFGKEASLAAGFFYAKGDIVVAIDADLEEPPSTIVAMVKQWQAGYQVVYGVKASRKKDSFIKRSTANLFYHFYQKLTSLNMPRGAADFILMDRKVVDALNRYGEKNRFTRGLIYGLGFRSISIYFDRSKRLYGETKWSIIQLFSYAMDAITANSTRLLRFSSHLGIFFSLASLLYGLWIIMRTILFGIDLNGYASLFSAIVFMGGIQLISVGIIGEYLSRIFVESKNRPLYHVNETINIIIE